MPPTARRHRCHEGCPKAHKRTHGYRQICLGCLTTFHSVRPVSNWCSPRCYAEARNLHLHYLHLVQKSTPRRARSKTK